MTGGPSCQGERASLHTLLGRSPGGPWADLEAGPIWSLMTYSYFLYFLSLFYFLISELFDIFCKFDSNQIKQLPKMFYSSLQCFKTVINQVFKIIYVFQ
jgi:hypothetical protein